MFVRYIIIALIAFTTITSAYAQADKKTEKGKKSPSQREFPALWGEIKNLPSGIFARGEPCLDSTVQVIKVRTDKGDSTNWCAIFPSSVKVNGQKLDVEALIDKDPKQLPRLMVRLPGYGDRFTLESIDFMAFDSSEYQTRPVVVKLLPHSIKVYFHVKADFVKSSHVASDRRVCLAVDRSSACIENSRIFAGEYVLRYKHGQSAGLGRKCKVTFAENCDEEHRRSFPRDQFDASCKDREVRVGCTTQASADGQYGVVQSLIQDVPLPERVTICAKHGCYSYVVGSRVTIYPAMNTYTFSWPK